MRTENLPPRDQPSSDHETALELYRAHALDLADLTRASMNLAREHHDDEIVARGRELLARLAEDRFNLAVVGQFSRGKSTLINALLGGEYLPVGALPMTSVVTNVTYGDRPRAQVQRRGTSSPHEVPLDDLERYIAESSLDREELRVETVDVELPAEMLRLGVTFVDTPGVGSAITANTDTTRRFLPDADAVIFVTSFDSPLTEPEAQFLQTVRANVERLFVVVNKVDLVTPSEVNEITAYLVSRLATHAQEDVRVFPVSARGALNAKLRRSPDDFARSGLPALEGALTRFLTTDKSREMLTQTARRVQRLVVRERHDLDLGRAAASGDVQAHLASFQAHVEALCARNRAAGEQLAREVADATPGWLATHEPRWIDEFLLSLRSVAVRAIELAAGEHSAAQLADTAISSINKEAPGLLQEWLRGARHQLRRFLMERAASELASLDELRRSVEPALEEALALPSTASDQIDVPPFELAFLMPRTPSWTVAAKVPRRLEIGSRSQAQRRATQFIDVILAHAVAEYSPRVRDSLLGAAREWVDTVAEHNARSITSAAERLEQMVASPVTDTDLRVLSDLDARLEVFARTIAEVPVAQSPAGNAPAALGAPEPVHIAKTGCVLCKRLERVLFDYLASAQYRLAGREQSQISHAQVGGFCPLHTWDYAHITSDLGLAAAYAHLADTTATSLQAAADAPLDDRHLLAAAVQLVQTPKDCPACRAIADAEQKWIDKAAAAPWRTDGELPVLCLLHLIAVLREMPDDDRMRELVESTAQRLRASALHMRSYALKRESLMRHLLTADEKAAHRATLDSLVGRRSLVLPWFGDELVF